ncbi:MAG: cyclomaltodextrinase, partial [Fervidobacterium sp.]
FFVGKGKDVFQKAELYKKGILRNWNDSQTIYEDKKSNVFYGGDLWGITEKVNYLKELGINVVYLTPIFSSPSNHKYDTIDYFKVDKQLGGLSAFKKMIGVFKKANIKLILDGVFNHVSDKHTWFKKAKTGNKDYISRFSIYEDGHRGWWGFKSLPELHLEENSVQKHIRAVIEFYLGLGVDGWRLDCGQDLGPVNNAIFASIVKNFSIDKYIVSELWTYPDRWDMIDGIMNYHFRESVLSYLNGELNNIGKVLEKMCYKTKNIYGCWNMLDSHDTQRLASIIPDKNLRKLAILLQFTFPGVPVVYYGTEIGMKGGNDPDCRRPMIWDETSWDVELMNFYKKLINLRKNSIGLKIGKFELIREDPLVFLRKAPYVLDNIIVAINKGKEKSIAVSISDGRILDRTIFIDLFTNERFKVTSGILRFFIPEKGFRVLRIHNETVKGYDQYKRIF